MLVVFLQSCWRARAFIRTKLVKCSEKLLETELFSEVSQLKWNYPNSEVLFKCFKWHIWFMPHFFLRLKWLQCTESVKHQYLTGWVKGACISFFRFVWIVRFCAILLALDRDDIIFMLTAECFSKELDIIENFKKKCKFLLSSAFAVQHS